MSVKQQLPKGFEALEPYVANWVLADSQARSAKRISTPYTEIEAFYRDMLAHAKAALELLQDCSLGAMSPPDERLLKLMLALAEVGPAVEWYQQSDVPDGFDPRRFPLTVQLSDTAAQGIAS